MLHRGLYILVLSFSLLFAQQAASTHALSHLGNATGHTHQDKKSTNSEQCAKCLAFSQLGSSCNTPTQFFAPQHHAQVCCKTVTTHCDSYSHTAYLSRAPPYHV